jgi:hypothetical protein
MHISVLQMKLYHLTSIEQIPKIGGETLKMQQPSIKIKRKN